MVAIEKYLSVYAEPETASFAQNFVVEKRYRHLLVIPVYDEPWSFLENTFGAVETGDSMLVILVINIPRTEKPDTEHAAAKQNTLALLNRLHTEFPIKWGLANKQIILQEYSKQTDLLVIDRCTEGREIPRRQGVGIARKLGCDIGCWLIQNQYVCSEWIHSTDADTQLPVNYLSANLDTSCSAMLYPYQHHCQDKDIELAMSLYELSLHYYVAGLNWAASPYSFHTLGSIIAINYRHYAQARGFPKKSAAEDFYLLNKLSKISPVRQLEEPSITILGRSSSRVPFGTGPALNKIKAQPNPTEEFLYYNPAVFSLLRQWLALFPHFWQARKDLNETTLWPFISKQLGLQNIENEQSTILASTLKNLNPQQAILQALTQSKSEKAFLRHMHVWFDALRTLKFIHHARDSGLFSRPLKDSVMRAEFIVESDPQHFGWQRDRIAALTQTIMDDHHR